MSRHDGLRDAASEVALIVVSLGKFHLHKLMPFRIRFANLSIYRPELQFLSYSSLPIGSYDCDLVIAGPSGGPGGSGLGVP